MPASETAALASRPGSELAGKAARVGDGAGVDDDDEPRDSTFFETRCLSSTT